MVGGQKGGPGWGGRGLGGWVTTYFTEHLVLTEAARGAVTKIAGYLGHVHFCDAEGMT